MAPVTLRLTLFLSILVLLFLPIAVFIAMGLVVAASLSVIHHRIAIKLGDKSAALLLSSLITVLIILPLVISLIYLGESALQSYNQWRATHNSVSSQDFFMSLVNHPRVRSLLILVSRIFPVRLAELVEILRSLFVSSSVYLMDRVGNLITQFPSFLVGLCVGTITFYFSLQDGNRLLRWIRALNIVEPRLLEGLLLTAREASRSVLLAAFVSGLVQGLISVIALAVMNQSSPLLQAVVIFLASFIPLIGAAPYFLGSMLFHFWSQDDLSLTIALLLLIITTLLDQILRPILMKGSSNLHPYLSFVAAIGGLKFFGIFGVFLGPICVAIATEGLRLSKTTHKPSH